MCKVTAETVQTDGKVIGTALDNLAAAIDPTDPTLAAELTTAGNTIIAATANWKTGDSLSIITDAEQAVIVVLNVVPVTSPFAPLVAIVFTALNLLIANAQTQVTQTGSVIADAHTLLVAEKSLNTDSPWHGKAEISHDHGLSLRKNFEASWNAQAPALGVATVTV